MEVEIQVSQEKSCQKCSKFWKFFAVSRELKKFFPFHNKISIFWSRNFSFEIQMCSRLEPFMQLVLQKSCTSGPGRTQKFLANFKSSLFRKKIRLFEETVNTFNINRSTTLSVRIILNYFRFNLVSKYNPNQLEVWAATWEGVVTPSKAKEKVRER